MSPLIELNDLPGTANSHSLVGADHGDVPVSLIFVHSSPGAGPELHRHPYPEVFVIEAGQATFEVGDSVIVAERGQIVIAPANAYHGFKNTGAGELRLTAIHTAPTFTTEWLAQADPSWASTARVDA